MIKVEELSDFSDFMKIRNNIADMRESGILPELDFRHGNEAAGLSILKLSDVAFSKFPEKTVEILAILNGMTVEEYKTTMGGKAFADFKAMFETDGTIVNFFAVPRE